MIYINFLRKHKCTICNKFKSISCFYRNKNTTSGYVNQCKLCLSQRKKEQYNINREFYLLKGKEYRSKNYEKVRQKDKERWWLNRNSKLLQQKEYRENNKQKIKEANRMYRENNKDKIKEKNKQYIKDNFEKIKNNKKLKSLRRCNICGNCGYPRELFKKGSYICKACLKPNEEKCIICSKISSRIINNVCINCYHKSPLRYGYCKFCNKKNKRLYSVEKQLCTICYEKEKRKIDEKFDIGKRLRSRLQTALRIYTKTGKILTSKQYGINYKAIIDHLGPCPGNRKEYHIDHIKPISSFNLNDPEEVKKAFKPENHQWLLSLENMKKGKKYNC